MRIWHGKWRWVAFAFVVLFLWAAYWPVPRIEVTVSGGGARYYSVPSNRRFQVRYETAGERRTEVRSFRVEGDGRLRLVETIMEPAPPGWRGRYAPGRATLRGRSLVVREDTPPFPALHVVTQPGSLRILRLGRDQVIDFSTLFPDNTVVTIRVAKKPVLFFLWKRYRG